MEWTKFPENLPPFDTDVAIAALFSIKDSGATEYEFDVMKWNMYKGWHDGNQDRDIDVDEIKYWVYLDVINQ